MARALHGMPAPAQELKLVQAHASGRGISLLALDIGLCVGLGLGLLHRPFTIERGCAAVQENVLVQAWAGCLSGSIGINLLALDLQSYTNIGDVPGNRREDVFQPTLNLVLPYYVSTAVIGLLPLVRSMSRECKPASVHGHVIACLPEREPCLLIWYLSSFLEKHGGPLCRGIPGAICISFQIGAHVRAPVPVTQLPRRALPMICNQCAQVFLRHMFILRYRLPFPSGTATGVMINGLHTASGSAEGMKQVPEQSRL